MNPRAIAWILVIAVAVYLVLLGQLAVRFIATGELVGIGLGLSILAFPLLGAWVIWREMRFGYTMQHVAAAWSQYGRDPQSFAYESALAAVESDPADWARWFELGLAYNAAGDRRRARGAMREAATRFPAESSEV